MALNKALVLAHNGFEIGRLAFGIQDLLIWITHECPMSHPVAIHVIVWSRQLKNLADMWTTSPCYADQLVGTERRLRWVARRPTNRVR